MSSKAVIRCVLPFTGSAIWSATEVTAGLTESNGRLLLGIWRDSLHVACGLFACTPGSAPGRTLGNEYGKTLPFFNRVSVLGTMVDQSNGQVITCHIQP